MTANANPPVGVVGLLPPLAFDVPSDSVSLYNQLINSLNAQLLSGTATGPQFADTTTGNLQSQNIAAQIAILVELRVQNNLLVLSAGTSGVPDLEQMRADELNNIAGLSATI